MKNTQKISTKEEIAFPSTVVAPVKKFLLDQLKNLRARKKDISNDDPFREPGRALDNAAPDTDAEEQFGHARASAIKSELNTKIIQTRRALSRIKIGKYGTCVECGRMIDTDRLSIYPEATICVNCEKKRERKAS